jgi:hypothetical protein
VGVLGMVASQKKGTGPTSRPQKRGGRSGIVDIGVFVRLRAFFWFFDRFGGREGLELKGRGCDKVRDEVAITRRRAMMTMRGGALLIFFV